MKNDELKKRKAGWFGKLTTRLKELVMLLFLYWIQRLNDSYSIVIGIQSSAIIFKFAKLFLNSYFSKHFTRILVSTQGEKIKEITKGRRYYKTIPPIVLFFNNFSKQGN